MLRKCTDDILINIINNKHELTSKNDLPATLDHPEFIRQIKTKYFMWYNNNSVHRINDLIASLYYPTPEILRYKKYGCMYKYNGYAMYNKLLNKEYLFTYGVCCEYIKDSLDS